VGTDLTLDTRLPLPPQTGCAVCRFVLEANPWLCSRPSDENGTREEGADLSSEEAATTAAAASRPYMWANFSHAIPALQQVAALRNINSLILGLAGFSRARIAMLGLRVSRFSHPAIFPSLCLLAAPYA